MTMRSNANFLAAAFALVFTLVYLFLPVYSVMAILPVNGLLLTQYNALLGLPAVAGVLMVVAAIVFPAAVSAAISGGMAAAMLILMFCGKALITSNAYVAMISSYLTVNGVNMLSLVHVAPGIGGVIGIMLCIAAAAAELIMASRQPQIQSQSAWTYQSRTTGTTPPRFPTGNMPGRTSGTHTKNNNRFPW